MRCAGSNVGEGWHEHVDVFKSRWDCARVRRDSLWACRASSDDYFRSGPSDDDAFVTEILWGPLGVQVPKGHDREQILEQVLAVHLYPTVALL